jgi:hypothetical protein
MHFCFRTLRSGATAEVRVMEEIVQLLFARAEEKFGRLRADELRSDIEQVAADLNEVAAAKIESDDEP